VADDMATLLTNAICLKRLQLNTLVFQQLGGVVKYGPLAGFTLIEDSSWGNDKCAKLLGFYEQELLAEMVPSLGADKVFVDIGAADGFYAVGFVNAGHASRCIAFEATEAGRAVIEETARRLDLLDRVDVRGFCTEASLREALAGLDMKDVVLLCDIEGAEFEILSDAVLSSLSGASLFVEIHDFIESGPALYLALKERAKRWFKVKEIKKAGRNPYHYAELDHLDDSEHWLVCSEGRAPDQKWLSLTPIHG
jgi:hypothetical protein